MNTFNLQTEKNAASLHIYSQAFSKLDCTKHTEFVIITQQQGISSFTMWLALSQLEQLM